MKLTHLGASYTPSNRTIDTVETETELSFMGRTYKMRAPQSTPAKSVNHRLTYRGVPYKV